MKQIALLMLLTIAASYAAEKKAAASPAKTKPAAASEVTIPKDAVKVDNNTYRATDAQGKTWIYRRTPFGVSKSEEQAPSAAEAAEKAKLIAATKAVERGDEIEFARPGPFGTYRWQRKKTELNDMEKAVWERERQKSGGAGKQE